MPRLAVRKNETNVAIAKFLSGGGSLREHEAAPQSKFGWPSVSPHVSHLDPEYKLLGNDSGGEADLYVVHDLYHWLNEATSYDAEADAVWQQYLIDYPGQHDGEDGFWEPARDFPEWYGKYLARKEWEEEPENAREDEPEDYIAGGIYGDKSGPVGEYTYNVENCLSSDLHFVYWEWHNMRGDDGYVVISFGGSHSILLRTSIDGNGTVGWFDFNRWMIGCTECRAIWSYGSTGGEWNGADYAKHNVLALNEYNAREGDAIDAAFLNATNGVLVGDEKPWIVIEQHSQYPDESTTVWCPHCGTGKLTPWFY